MFTDVWESSVRYGHWQYSWGTNHSGGGGGLGQGSCNAAEGEWGVVAGMQQSQGVCPRANTGPAWTYNLRIQLRDNV